MNEKESSEWLEFRMNHGSCKKRFSRKHLELYIKRYSDSGIGYTACCDNCKTYIDITDYDCW